MFFTTDSASRRDAAHSRRAAAIGCGLLSAVVAAAIALARLPLASDAPEHLWLDAVRWCLVATLGWAAVVTSVSVVELLSTASRPQSGCTALRPARWLTTFLLTVSAWNVAAASDAQPAPPSACAEHPTPSPDFLPAVDEEAAPDTDTDRCLPTPTSTPDGATRTAPSAPAPDWTPTTPKAVAPGNRSPLLMAGSRPAESRTVVVRRGDSLWSIVARHLGPDADPVRIAADVPRWHSANQAIIGDDPNFLLPGQQLTPPDRDAVGGPR